MQTNTRVSMQNNTRVSMQNNRARPEGSLFITRVSNFYTFDDEKYDEQDDYEIPKHLEDIVIKRVTESIDAMCIGEVRRVDLKVTNNNNTGKKFIDAFVHLFWHNNLSARQSQSNLEQHGQFLCAATTGKVWIVRKNKNPMSFEEISLMKQLGPVIKTMKRLYNEVRTITWTEIELDDRVKNMDDIVRCEQMKLEEKNGKSPYGPRYVFMWVKYNTCIELIERMQIFLSRLTGK